MLRKRKGMRIFVMKGVDITVPSIFSQVVHCVVIARNYFAALVYVTVTVVI